MRTFDEMLYHSTGSDFVMASLMLLLLPIITSSLFANSKWAVIELNDDGDQGKAMEGLVDLGGDGRLAKNQNIHEKEGYAGAGDHNHNDYAGLVHHNEHHNVQNGVMQDMLDMQMATHNSFIESSKPLHMSKSEKSYLKLDRFQSLFFFVPQDLILTVKLAGLTQNGWTTAKVNCPQLLTGSFDEVYL